MFQLMKIKMFQLIKKIFISLLSISGSTVSKPYCNFMKQESLNNQPYMTRLTILNLNPDDCINISLWLIQRDLIEFVILLMIYPIEYAFPTKENMYNK